MKKKIFIIGVIIAMLVAILGILTGCGNSQEQNINNNSSSSSSNTDITTENESSKLVTDDQIAIVRDITFGNYKMGDILDCILQNQTWNYKYDKSNSTFISVTGTANDCNDEIYILFEIENTDKDGTVWSIKVNGEDGSLVKYEENASEALKGKEIN